MRVCIILGLFLMPVGEGFAQGQNQLEVGVYGGHTLAGGAMLIPELRESAIRKPFAGMYLEMSLNDRLNLIHSTGYHHQGYEIVGNAYGYNGQLSQHLQYLNNTFSLRYQIKQFGLNAGLLIMLLTKAEIEYDKKSRVANGSNFGKVKVFQSFGIDWRPKPRLTVYLQTQCGLEMLQSDKFMNSFTNYNGDVVFYSTLEMGLRIQLTKFTWAKKDRPTRNCDCLEHHRVWVN